MAKLIHILVAVGLIAAVWEVKENGLPSRQEAEDVAAVVESEYSGREDDEGNYFRRGVRGVLEGMRE